jgi:hypothetical protein
MAGHGRRDSGAALPLMQQEVLMDMAEKQGLLSLASFKTLWMALTASDKELNAGQAASTLFRFFRSKHVVDLRLIAAMAAMVFCVHCAIVLYLGSLDASDVGTEPSPHGQLIEFFKFAMTYIAPAIPIYGAVVAWAYLSAASRLGVVDLFACEIATLCRVGTIFDVGKRLIDRSENDKVLKVAGSANYVSNEDYFPVFQANSRDLQVLEALVVTRITEFYTYAKASRDSQRKFAQILSSQAEQGAEPTARENVNNARIASLADIIYMLFLGYESARKAINDLIEFQPTAVENKMVILLTELRCYAFLIKHFKNDPLKYARLKLRNYEKEMKLLKYEVTAEQRENDPDWIPAIKTFPELERRYQEALRADEGDQTGLSEAFRRKQEASCFEPERRTTNAIAV